MSYDNKKYLPRKASNSIYKRTKNTRTPDCEPYWKNRMFNPMEIEINRLKSLYTNKLSSLDNVFHSIINLIVENFKGNIPDSVKNFMQSLGHKNREVFVEQLEDLITSSERLNLQEVKALAFMIYYSN